MPKKDIKNFTREELKKELTRIGEKQYKADQIFHWLYKKGVDGFADMTNLSKGLIDKLDETYFIGTLKMDKHLKSQDGTEKFVFELDDKNFIETVFIPSGNRSTVCISTQVGCKFSCIFCASGIKGFIRNLATSEILNQIIFLSHNLKKRITNCVFMGMGEPLDNYDNVMKAIQIMNDAKGMAIGARRITISTCGIIPAIEKLKNFKSQINLSISLHAANDELRNKLMPINKRYPIEELIKAGENYIKIKGRILMLEYILIHQVNDSRKNALELANIAKRLKAKVNLIPYSPNKYADFKPAGKSAIDIFIKALNNSGVTVTIRESKGRNIKAACGQLAGCFN